MKVDIKNAVCVLCVRFFKSNIAYILLHCFTFLYIEHYVHYIWEVYVDVDVCNLTLFCLN